MCFVRSWASGSFVNDRIDWLIFTRSPFNLNSPASPNPMSFKSDASTHLLLRHDQEAMCLALLVGAHKVRHFLFDKDPKVAYSHTASAYQRWLVIFRAD